MTFRSLVLWSFVAFSSLHAQDIPATTKDGREVILRKDGTWQYRILGDSAKSDNLKTFRKSDNARALFTTKNDKFFVWYDPTIWTEEETEGIKTTFRHKDGDVFAMVIPERAEMSLDALKNLALENARKAAPDTRVTLEESRIVNDSEVLCMKLEGTTKGIGLVIYGYYYAGKQGVIQLLCFTYPNLFSDYYNDMSNFLNGLVIQE